MTDGIYIDNDKRKRIVTFWIPMCLGFLHLWGTALIIATCLKSPKHFNREATASMFADIKWGIAGLIFLLISDKAVELIISRLTGITPVAQTVTETTTKQTIVKPTEKQEATDDTEPKSIS